VDWLGLLVKGDKKMDIRTKVAIIGLIGVMRCIYYVPTPLLRYTAKTNTNRKNH
jgi:hypothetical protein